jgi:hypothetical protein
MLKAELDFLIDVYRYFGGTVLQSNLASLQLITERDLTGMPNGYVPKKWSI